jgi:hypothetical protein
MPRGGARVGAGRPPGTGPHREPTISMRVPLSLVPEVSSLLSVNINQSANGSQPRLSSLTACFNGWAAPPAGRVSIAGPVSARTALESLNARGVKAAVVHLDPWYRDKNARGRTDVLTEMLPLLHLAARVGQHVFVWGWPEAVARLVDHIPKPLALDTWLTWSYKNAPSRSRGWRPAQQSCLHLRCPSALLYPEHFYSNDDRARAAENRLEFKPSPRSVIESALLVGWVKRSEQTGYRAQKPVEVIETLLRMTTVPGDLVVDPTCGSGTTGAAAVKLGCCAMLSDRTALALRTTRRRLAPFIDVAAQNRVD